MSLENIVLVLGGTLSGLIAGVYYAFNVAFVPALRHLNGKQHIAAMQAINQKIKNPVFFLSFFGPSVLLPIAAWMHRGAAQFPLLVIAALLHIIGGVGVTVGGNIPLNERLDQVKADTLTEAEADKIRREFQAPGSAWMRFHNIRTLTTTAATVLVLIAALSKR